MRGGSGLSVRMLVGALALLSLSTNSRTVRKNICQTDEKQVEFSSASATHNFLFRFCSLSPAAEVTSVGNLRVPTLYLIELQTWNAEFGRLAI